MKLYLLTALLQAASVTIGTASQARGGYDSYSPQGRYGHCTFVVGGKMYALGGAPFNQTGTGYPDYVSGGLSSELMVFDPFAGTWALLNAAATGDAPFGIDRRGP
jgi:hypothetical protein